MSTLKEVAELTGVSVATASLALNHNARIKESTRKKVSAWAKALNYVPNRIGRTFTFDGRATPVAPERNRTSHARNSSSQRAIQGIRRARRGRFI